MRAPADIIEAFRGQGLRITPQRVAVLEALHASTGHPTAEAIYQQVSRALPSISLRTVYQLLNDLTDMGEIRRLDVGVEASRFDPNTDDHHHLVCDTCGVMVDFYLDVSVLNLGELGGFQPSSTQVFVSGRCSACATSAGDAAAAPTVQ